MPPQTKVILKSPNQCQEADKQAFFDLLILGDEVNPQSLCRLIERARILAFLYSDNGSLIGTGAIKCPYESYRRKVFRRASATTTPDLFTAEVGWVFIRKEWRGKRLSHVILAAVGEHIRRPTYATSREDNRAMHKGLKRLGFVQNGSPYFSDDNRYRLLLFIKA